MEKQELKKDAVKAVVFALIIALSFGFGVIAARADDIATINEPDGRAYIIIDSAPDIDTEPTQSNTPNALETLESAVTVVDDCPYNDSVPLSKPVQAYLWQKCKDMSSEYKTLYTFVLGLIDQESDFNQYAKSRTNDYGLCQTNKKWVYPDVKKVFGLTDITDCYDPYVSIDCCFWELSQKLDTYGITERLYYWYNTGRKTGSSNANSRAMVKQWQHWESVIWGK